MLAGCFRYDRSGLESGFICPSHVPTMVSRCGVGSAGSSSMIPAPAASSQVHLEPEIHCFLRIFHILKTVSLEKPHSLEQHLGGRSRAGGSLWIWAQSGLHSEFQANQLRELVLIATVEWDRTPIFWRSCTFWGELYLEGYGRNSRIISERPAQDNWFILPLFLVPLLPALLNLLSSFVLSLGPSLSREQWCNWAVIR